MRSDLTTSDVGPHRRFKSEERVSQVFGGEDRRALGVEDRPAVLEEPESEVVVGRRPAGEDRDGGFSGRRRPMTACRVGDRQERLPAILRTIVELRRQGGVIDRPCLDEAHVLLEGGPKGHPEFPGLAFSEAFDVFVPSPALHGDDDRAVEDRVWQAADARGRFGGEHIELDESEGATLGDGAGHSGALSVTAVEEGADALGRARLVGEDRVDLVEKNGRMVAVDLAEQDRLRGSADSPRVADDVFQDVEHSRFSTLLEGRRQGEDW